MKVFLSLIIIFIFFNKINAMNLLDNKINQNNFDEEWEFVSDQVMGGISEGKLNLKSEKNKKYLSLIGSVSTENNGGFIQFRSNYEFKNDNFKGIRIKAKGVPSDYFIHIRTNFLFLPWQYYSGKFEVTENWQVIEILFKDFDKSNFYQPSIFTSSEIKSIGFVAFGKDFDAQLDISEAELF